MENALDRIQVNRIDDDLAHVSIGHLHAGWIKGTVYEADMDAIRTADVNVADVAERLPIATRETRL